MAENLIINTSQYREEIYKTLIPQIKNLLEGEKNLISNMANISAAIMQTFHFLWVGFYKVENNDLVLYPFQGKIACTKIGFGKGVCGTAWKTSETQIVANVNHFEGHIACDAESVSEIVIPIIRNEKVLAVLDIDSEIEDNFSEIDKKYLTEIVNLLDFH